MPQMALIFAFCDPSGLPVWQSGLPRISFSSSAITAGSSAREFAGSQNTPCISRQPQISPLHAAAMSPFMANMDICAVIA